MSITVQNCLSLPAFHSCTLLAGKHGLDRIVSSVSVLELPESAYSSIKVFNPNELIITSFFAIKDDPLKQCEALRMLVERGCVALVLFYVDDIIQCVSDELTQTANILNVPLIVIDDKTEYSVRYSDVITDVMGAVFNDQIHTDDLSDAVKNRLTQIPDNKRSMEILLNVISEFYRCNIMLYNKNGLYFTSVYRPSYGEFSPEFFLSNFDDDSSDYSNSKVLLQDKSFYLYKKSFFHAGNSWLTLYISCNDNLLNEHIINEICTCTNFFSTLWGYSLDMHNSKTGISLIFKSSKIVGEKFLARNAIPFSAISTLIIIESKDFSLQNIINEINKIFIGYEQFYMADIIDDRIVILTSISSFGTLDDIVISEIKKVILSGKDVSMFIEKSKSLADMRRLYADYCSNAHAMHKIFLHRKILDVHDVVFVKEINDLGYKKGNRIEHIQSIITQLDSDADNLLETLAVYLIDCNSQLGLTASTLYLHRNTVTYRLNKIKKISNTDFTKMPIAYDYYLAAALWRLNH